MSKENLEVARSIYTAWERGDYHSVEWADPAIEYVIADGPSAGEWKGLAAFIEAASDWLRAWEEYRIEAEEFRELDDERVLVLSRRTGRGKTSGLELGQMRTQGAGLFHFRNGKVTRFVAYLDRKHALEAVGDAGVGGSAG